MFSGFQLVWCNSPIGRRVSFFVPPSRTSKKKPDIQTTVHTVETFGRVQHRQTCLYDCIVARHNTCPIPKLQCLSVLIFTWFFMQHIASIVEKVILSTVHGRNFNCRKLCYKCSLSEAYRCIFWGSWSEISRHLLWSLILHLSPIFFQCIPKREELILLGDLFPALFFSLCSLFTLSPSLRLEPRERIAARFPSGLS